MGITLLHLFISHHRLKIAKSPLMWQNTRKQAWLRGAIVWAIACAVAIFECVLHIGNSEYGSAENLQTCVWPGINKCTTRLSLYVQLLMFCSLSIVSGITYYFYIKAGKELKDNEIEKEYRIRSSSQAFITKKFGKRRITTPERAVVSLFTIFTVHCITQLPLYIYGITIHGIALKQDAGSGATNKSNENDDKGADIPFTGSIPILLLLLSIGFLTTNSPLVLACINRKFKDHVKYLCWYLCGSEDQAHQKFLHHITAKFPPPPVQEPPPTPPPATNFQVFYTPASRQKLYAKSNIASYIKSGGEQSMNPKQQYLDVRSSSRPDRVSQTSSVLSVTPRPSRVSSTSVSAGLAAVNAGLVISAPGHRVMINNFFLPDANEALIDELTTLNLI